MDIETIIPYGLAAIAGFFILRALSRGIRGRRMLVARLTKEYRQALDGSDRQKALAAGREYYKFFRPDRKLTIYDEQAIDNDMKMMPSEKVPVVVDQSNTIVDQLERLAKLKEKGILTDSEFSEQKAKILRV
ncbi:SHOCT domain-containing protein [Labilibaculum sp.]|uniref:SHOCT domain-containing protein n=1 Tax=Labilibaculum sp. TaxID=2060723 RepID=UPI0035665B1D